MVRPKNETGHLFFSITKICETHIEQTQKKAEETLEFKGTKPRKTFHFKSPIQIKEDCMIGLKSLEVYNFIFNITERNNKFEPYKFADSKSGNVSYGKVRDEIKRDLDISDITATDLQDGILAPINIEEYREQVTKRMKDDGYMKFLAGYIRSIFQDFEKFLRTEVDFVEDDVRLIIDRFDEYNSSFITYELQPGIYTFKDVSEVLFNILQPEYPGPSNVIVIEFDDISMTNKLVVRDGVIAKRFNEKLFFSTVLGFTPHWDYKHFNEYISQTIVNSRSTNKIHLKFECTNGSKINGVQQPILYSLVLDKPAGYKVISEPETIHYKKKQINLFWIL